LTQLKIFQAAGYWGVVHNMLMAMDELSFLTIESDGAPFSHVGTAKLETFLFHGGRFDAKMLCFCRSG
jgi:hypothetical protein